MNESILSPTFLFQFSVPCLYAKELWTAQGVPLGEEYRIPSFGELEGRRLFGELRLGWNEQGISFALRVQGKKQLPSCRSTWSEIGDGLQLWFDTRATHNIHRASRFCHRFAFQPAGGGRNADQPVCTWVPINRARENSKAAPTNALRVRSEKRSDGYLLDGLITSDALSGFDPTEHPRMGFFYAITDRELGTQTFSVGEEFPYVEDPSLWGDLELGKS